MRSKKSLAIRGLYHIGAIKVGRFVLSSGLESPYYVDLRLALSNPHLVVQISELMLEAVRSFGFDYVVGIATGGLPWATILAYTLRKPLAYVRREAKGHGTRSSLEGSLRPGISALVVDDVLTTGFNISKAVELLRENGVGDISALVVLDREQCGRARLEELGVEVASVIRISEVVEELAPEYPEIAELVDYVRSAGCPGKTR